MSTCVFVWGGVSLWHNKRRYGIGGKSERALYTPLTAARQREQCKRTAHCACARRRRRDAPCRRLHRCRPARAAQGAEDRLLPRHRRLPSLPPLVPTGGGGRGPDDGFVLDTGTGTGARHSSKRAAPGAPAPRPSRPTAPTAPTVPARPPSPQYAAETGARTLLSTTERGALGEYSADERQLNEFLKLHLC